MASVQSAACRRWYFGHYGNRDNGGASRRVGSNTRWCQKWWNTSVGEWEKRIINNVPRTACVQCSRLPEGRVGSARQQHELSSERRDDHVGWRRCVACSHHLCPAMLLLSRHEFERISPSGHCKPITGPCMLTPELDTLPVFLWATARTHLACARSSNLSLCSCLLVRELLSVFLSVWPIPNHAVALKVAHPHMHHATS
jgi:hypothetical protein